LILSWWLMITKIAPHLHIFLWCKVVPPPYPSFILFLLHNDVLIMFSFHMDSSLYTHYFYMFSFCHLKVALTPPHSSFIDLLWSRVDIHKGIPSYLLLQLPKRECAIIVKGVDREWKTTPLLNLLNKNKRAKKREVKQEDQLRYHGKMKVVQFSMVLIVTRGCNLTYKMEATILLHFPKDL
jgi:hypothetical protein